MDTNALWNVNIFRIEVRVRVCVCVCVCVCVRVCAFMPPLTKSPVALCFLVVRPPVRTSVCTYVRPSGFPLARDISSLAAVFVLVRCF